MGAMSQGSVFLHEFEATCAARLASLLKAAGIAGADDIAAKAAKSLADYLALDWGGQNVYISKDNPRRFFIMYEEFTGDNHAELAKKYNLSVPHVYKVIKQIRDFKSLKQLSLLEL